MEQALKLLKSSNYCEECLCSIITAVVMQKTLYCLACSGEHTEVQQKCILLC